jgi:ribosomal protein L40E
LADTLTESFCERCGTRYEFTAPTRLNPLRKTRGLFGGLKNYLTSQDALSDAIGDAMRDEEGALASAQLEAFHESFNFCIDCRQYTCVNCWNDDAGRCRSCQPIAGTDDLAERLQASLDAGAPSATLVEEPMLAADDLDRRLGTEQWPTSDLPEPAFNGHAALTESWPVAEAQVAPEIETPGFVGADGFVYETQAQADAAGASLLQQIEAAAAADDQQAAAEQPAEPDWEAVAAELAIEQAAAEAETAAPPPPLRVVGWDEDAAYEVELEPIAAEVVEPEPVVAEATPEPEPEPEPVAEVVEPEPVVAEVVAEAAPEPEPEPVAADVVEPEPEPVAADVVEPEPVVAEATPEPEPEPTPAPRPIAPISETILHFPEPGAAPAAHAPVEQEPVAAQADSPELAARRAQLDLLGLGDPGEGPVEPARPNVLPYRSRGQAATPAELAALAAQGARFWEASAQEVASAVGNVGIQNCGECGLSLSANARFCRRCGTRQARSA